MGYQRQSSQGLGAGLIAALLGLTAWIAPVFGDAPSAAPEPTVDPTFEQILSLERVAYPVPSPDGSAVVFMRRHTDWQDNRFDRELWLKPEGAPAFQLTRTADGSSDGAAWSPDGRWIAFLADRGAGRQVFVISPRGGEARPLTAVEGGVQAFVWRPGTLLDMVLKVRDAKKPAKSPPRFGKFRLAGRTLTPSPSHLWLMNVKAALATAAGLSLDPTPPPPASEPADATGDVEVDDEAIGDEPSAAAPIRRLTNGAFTVTRFAMTPTGDRLVFAHRQDPTPEGIEGSDLSWLRLDDEAAAQGATPVVHPLVRRAGRDEGPTISPDGRRVAFETAGDEPHLYGNRYVAVVALPSGEDGESRDPEVAPENSLPTVRILGEGHDGRPGLVAWTDDGIFFLDQERARRRLFRLDPEAGVTTAVDGVPQQVWGAGPAEDGEWLIYGQNELELAEIWRCPGALFDPPGVGVAQLSPVPLKGGPACRPLTEAGRQIADWRLGGRRLFEWTSADGLDLEGILFTPPGFDSSRTYPLLVVVHGGPVATSFAETAPGAVYPVLQWLADGALVFMPNYRGSDGYGAALRRAAVGELGRGDVGDVLSGVDALIAQGFVDSERVGIAGWSQGGFIAAMAAVRTERFRAASVGAGITDWTLYYGSTDLGPFAPSYFQGEPWDQGPDYDAASPLHHVKQASTPVLIQHGERDQRVSPIHAELLHRALSDAGVPVEWIVYRGSGHAVGGPKDRLTAAEHNLRWFRTYLWSEDLSTGDETGNGESNDMSLEQP